MRFNRLAKIMNKRRRARAADAATPVSPARVPMFEPLEGRTMLAGGRGFAAYYFAGTDFAQLKTRREDSQINFDWRNGGDGAVTPGGFGAHYSGRVMPKYSETYHFYTRSTGGVRVWVNDQLILNDWTTHALKDNVGSIALQAGQRYDVRIEYFDTTSASQFQFHWRSRRQAREVVPTGRLFASAFDTTRPSAPTKLKATYVTDTAYKFIWDAATDTAPGGIVYDVYSAKTRMGATTETSFTRGGRNPLNNYGLTVRAVDWAGNVTVSAPLLITTKAFVGAGSGSGLAGRYYDSPSFTDLRMLRTDAQVLFGWQGNPFDGGADRDFSARWEGSVLARYDEVYTFSFLTDGAAKVWVGGVLLVNQPEADGAPREPGGTMKLRAGRRYSVRIEYQHRAGHDAMAALSWSSLSTRKQAVPVQQLDPAFTDAAAPTSPPNLRVDGATQNAISLRWDASTDDFGVVHYDVFRNGEKVGSTSNLNYTDPNLSPDTSYGYQVVAVDVAGKSSATTAPLIVRTLAPPPVRNAFGTIEATSYNANSGVSTSGNVITGLDDNDWVRYDRLDFGGGGVRSLQIKLGASTGGAGGTIEVRLGSRDGQLIGRHVVQPTGSYGTRYTQRLSVDGVSGLHDVYLVFKNRANVANVESFKFSTQRLTRVMAVGDSITDGQANRNSYRYFLYRKLIDAGHGVDFVGERTRNDSGDPANFDFDQNHEGYSGERADFVLAHIVGWVQEHDPEIVLLHIGTNDIWQGQSVPTTVGEVGQIIDAIRSVDPSIRVVLAQLIPLAGYDALITDFNTQLATMAADKVAGGANLGVVDMHTGFSLSSDTDDGVHPNNSGADKMAGRWFDAIDGFLA